MTTPFEVLFTLTLYRNGQVRVGGHGQLRAGATYAEALPDILRTVALAIEDGALLLNEEGEPWPE